MRTENLLAIRSQPQISLTNLMNQHSLQCNKVFEALQLFISTHPAHMAPCCLHLFLVFPTTHFFTNPYSSIHPCIHSRNTFWDTCACWGLCWDPGIQQEIRHCTQGLASTSGQRAHWMTVKKSGLQKRRVLLFYNILCNSPKIAQEKHSSAPICHIQ